MRDFLAEFLSDPRVVELPRWVWLPILHAIVLRTRPARSATKYQAIWTSEGSPLAVHTMRQTDLLRSLLPDVQVEYAMRYGEPSIPSGLKKLSGCRTLVVLPLYPQYSRSTTESVRDRLPAGTKMVEQFHDASDYIAALAALVERHWKVHGRGDKLLMSFHGLPRRAIEQGDPYQGQCVATAKILAGTLRLAPEHYLVTYQSRFGAAEWLQPYTDATLRQLARAGTRRVDILCPGFVSDCLETLEEIAIEGRQAFLGAGGREYHALPCLNEDPLWIKALAEVAQQTP